MAVTYRQFRIELYEEHLEEASFLYEQRCGLFDDPEITWLDIGEFEERLEAHIDALVVGGDLALDVCTRRAGEGDFGELFAALCVVCRQQRKDLATPILHRLADPETGAERMRAVGDALKLEMPAAWEQPLLTATLKGGHGYLLPVFTRIAGYRRLASGAELLGFAAGRPAEELAAVVTTLGLCPDPVLVPALEGLCRHADAGVRAAAALALLRHGDERGLALCRREAAAGNPAAVLPLGLAGGRSATAPLLAALDAEPTAAPALQALGLLGDLGALKALHDRLADADLAATAAASLMLILGAEPRERAFIPEVWSEDELFDDEKAAFRDGRPPMRPDGQPYGSNVERLSLKPEDWRDWYAARKAAFDARYRYRSGQLAGPPALIDSLAAAGTPPRLRALIADELAIRYGMPVPFAIDMPVVRQQAAIATMRRWAADSAPPFHPGGWYFAGGLLP